MHKNGAKLTLLALGLLLLAPEVSANALIETLGRGWELINFAEVYSRGGAPAQFIDAILTFLIVFTVVFNTLSRGEKKMPKPVGIAVGLMVWLPLVIYLYNTQILLLNQFFSVLTCVVILTAVAYRALHTGFISLAGKDGNFIKVLAFLLAASLVSGVLGGFLEQSQTSSAAGASAKDTAVTLYANASGYLGALLILGLLGALIRFGKNVPGIGGGGRLGKTPDSFKESERLVTGLSGMLKNGLEGINKFRQETQQAKAIEQEGKQVFENMNALIAESAGQTGQLASLSEFLTKLSASLEQLIAYTKQAGEQQNPQALKAAQEQLGSQAEQYGKVLHDVEQTIQSLLQKNITSQNKDLLGQHLQKVETLKASIDAQAETEKKFEEITERSLRDFERMNNHALSSNDGELFKEVDAFTRFKGLIVAAVQKLEREKETILGTVQTLDVYRKQMHSLEADLLGMRGVYEETTTSLQQMLQELPQLSEAVSRGLRTADAGVLEQARKHLSRVQQLASNLLSNRTAHANKLAQEAQPKLVQLEEDIQKWIRENEHLQEMMITFDKDLITAIRALEIELVINQMAKNYQAHSHVDAMNPDFAIRTWMSGPEAEIAKIIYKLTPELQTGFLFQNINVITKDIKAEFQKIIKTRTDNAKPVGGSA